MLLSGMPKAKPLPDDPVAREKVLRRRRQMVKGVKAWCGRNPEKVRVLKRYWKAAERLKQRGRVLAGLGDSA